MLTIKLNAWEGQFEEKILESRNEELRHVWTVLLISAMNVFLLWIAPSMVSVSTIAIYTKVMGQEVTAAKIFTALSLFRLLQSPLRALPGFITQFFQALTSLERLQNFFDLEENTFPGLYSDGKDDDAIGTDVKGAPGQAYDPGDICGGTPIDLGEVILTSAEFFWPVLSQVSNDNGNAPSCGCIDDVDDYHDHEGGAGVSFGLKVPSCEVRPGSLVVIQGMVGAGKSSLCYAILGEMPQVSGQRSVRGSVAYCSQQAWIQSATVKENILFGLPYDPVKYARVVDACCLGQDFEELPRADDTYIGQKGLNLSGGQKARCALARAVYADKNIYILDDVFAALDSIVGKRVFEQVVLGLLRNKTRILVTHKQELICHEAVTACFELSEGVLRRVDCASSSGPRDGDGYHDMGDTPPASPPHVPSFGGITSVALVPYEFTPTSSIAGKEDVGKEGAMFAGGISLTEGQKRRADGGIECAEEQETGSLGWRVYKGYVKAAGGTSVVAALLAIQTMWQLLSVGSDYFITQWSRQDEEQQKRLMDENIGLYAALALGSGLLVLARTLTVSTFGFRAAKKLFEDMLRALMYCPMHWMDKNPTGRLLNRFGDDQSQVDEGVPLSAGSVFSTGFSVAGSIITVLVITRYLGLFIIPAIYLYYQLMQVYLNAGREIQRLQSVSKSPMLTFIAESVDGLVQLRSFGTDCMWRAIAKNESMLDVYLGVSYVMAAGIAWFSLRIQLIGAFLILFVAVVLFIGSSTFISSGLIALSLSYMLSISDDIMTLVMIWSWFEQAMVCPERILQYVDLDREGTLKQRRLFRNLGDESRGEWDDSNDASSVRPLLRSSYGHVSGDEEDVEIVGEVLSRSVWPSEGVVEYRNVYFRYQPTQSDFVLMNVNFKTRPAEKIGIVGRVSVLGVIVCIIYTVLHRCMIKYMVYSVSWVYDIMFLD